MRFARYRLTRRLSANDRAPALALCCLIALSCAGSSEIAALRKENADLRARISDLESRFVRGDPAPIPEVDLRTRLQQVIAGAATDFEEIRGARRADGGYEATIRVFGSPTCTIGQSPGGWYYACDFASSDDKIATNRFDLLKTVLRAKLPELPFRESETIHQGMTPPCARQHFHANAEELKISMYVFYDAAACWGLATVTLVVKPIRDARVPPGGPLGAGP